MLDISSDEVHLWLLPDSGSGTESLSLLSAGEKARYQRLRFDRDRLRFLKTRAAIRHLLSRYDASRRPEEWAFGLGAHGRPELSSPHRVSQLSFNISHSKGLIAIALVSEGVVGVDTECVTVSRRAMELAERFFADPEYQLLCSVPEESREQRFYEFWTLKEACVKAMGAGLYVSLRMFSFAASSAAQIRVAFDTSLGGHSDAWQFWQLQYGNHAIAVALTGVAAPDHGTKRVSVFELDENARDCEVFPVLRSS